MKINYFESLLEASEYHIKNTRQTLRSAINTTNDKSNLPQTLNVYGNNVADTLKFKSPLANVKSI